MCGVGGVFGQAVAHQQQRAHAATMQHMRGQLGVAQAVVVRSACGAADEGLIIWQHAPDTLLPHPTQRTLCLSPACLRPSAQTRTHPQQQPPHLHLQLYSVALYVEGDLAAKELGIRSRGGFFETDDDFCSALVDGAFEKVLVVSRRGGDGDE